MPFKNNKEEIEEYLEVDQDPMEDVDASSSFPQTSARSRLKKLHFWSDWTKKKKLVVAGSLGLGSIILLSLIFAFVIRPSRTNTYIKNSWYDLVSASSDIERSVKSEVNLEGTREVADNLYSYNEKLSSITFQSKSKSNLSYTSKITQFASLTDKMSDYYSDSALLLAKSSSEENPLADSELESLKSKGQELKNEVTEFRNKAGLEQELSPDLLTLDVYISNVKLKKEQIEKEKAEEEEKKKKDELAAAEKESKDRASVQSVAESYYKAYINANESGIRATLSKGFETEYDFGSLSVERRSSFYPKSYRIIEVKKDSENYKVTSSVTYISIYKDSEGNDIQTSQPVTEIYRVVYSAETGSWKIDGRAEI